jgi:hypothetical protein
VPSAGIRLPWECGIAKIFNLDRSCATVIFCKAESLCPSIDNEEKRIGEKFMLIAANLLGLSLALQVPEGGAPWMYLLLAGAACVGALVLNTRLRTRRPSSN